MIYALGGTDAGLIVMLAQKGLQPQDLDAMGQQQFRGIRHFAPPPSELIYDTADVVATFALGGNGYHPLPDVVPRSLFIDLSLSDVNVFIPPATANDEEPIEQMSILLALN